jgi:hypothetical protein
MSDYLNRATTEARKARDAVSAAGEHGQKAAEDALAKFTKVAERAKDTLETLLAQAKPYVRQARPYLDDASAYYEKTRRRMSGRDTQSPVVLAAASIGAVLLLALLFTPKQSKPDTAGEQPGS